MTADLRFWAGWPWRPERRAVASLARIGGNVEFYPAGPGWARRLAGRRFASWLDRAGRLKLIGLRLNGVHLREVACLRGLLSLNLSHSELPPTALRQLRPLDRLRTLLVRCTTVDDDALGDLPSLTHLQVLALSGTRTAADGLRHVARCGANLERLELGRTRVTDDGLSHLGGLRRLTALDLSDTAVTGDGLRHLAGLTELRILTVARTPLAGVGLEHIGRLSGVTTLVLSGTVVDDTAVARLGPLPRLETLSLSLTRVGDGALAHLGGLGLAALRTLNLNNTAVTDAGLPHLERFPLLQHLSLYNTRVTDAGGHTLCRLQRLQELNIEGTGVSACAAARLRAAGVTVYGS